MKKTSILVTGCAGFIGSNFTTVFAKKFPSVEIVGLDDMSSGRSENISNNIRFYKGSICDNSLLDSIFKKHKPSYVFHFAAMPRVSYSMEKPAETSRTNIEGTALLLEKCREYKIKRLIFSSSSAIYGLAKNLPTNEADNKPNPVSPYAVQKLAGEHLCDIASKFYGFDTVSLRYFNVFGPRQHGDSAYSTVISAWLTGLYFPSKKKAFIEGTGKQSRDFVFVENVVEANILAMQSKKDFKGAIINIGDGKIVNLLQVKKLIEKLTHKVLLLEKRPTRAGDVLHTHADITRAKKLLKYKPIVPFEDGVKKTVAWFESIKT